MIGPVECALAEWRAALADLAAEQRALDEAVRVAFPDAFTSEVAA